MTRQSHLDCRAARPGSRRACSASSGADSGERPPPQPSGTAHRRPHHHCFEIRSPAPSPSGRGARDSRWPARHPPRIETNTTNETVLEAARAEIRESWRRTCADNADHPRAWELFDPERLPAFHDPFAGGGALPLEAQRLGLEAHASDLNPVAVLINKAMIEIPPKFAGRPPVNPEARSEAAIIGRAWPGAQGLAEDIRYYGRWMRDEAHKRIGHLYPPVEITPELVRDRPDLQKYQGRTLPVIAWLWARTVRSPNPAFSDVEVPLASSFMLSTRKNKEAYVVPVIEGREYRFTVKVGTPPDPDAAKSGTSAGKRRAFRCLISSVPLPYAHIRAEGKAGRFGSRLMAVVAEGDRERVYLSPSPEHASAARKAKPTWKPDCEMPRKHRNFQGPVYGLNNLGDLFTPRQLVALTTFSGLVGEAAERVQREATAAGLPDDGRPLREGGTGAAAYAEAVGLYLAFVLSKQTDLGNSLCRWEPAAQCPRQLFGRQAIPMIWDFAEGNPLGEASGGWTVLVKGIVRAFSKTVECVHASDVGCAQQEDASGQSLSNGRVVSTDPPYYDNIGYADLSDFFYVWLRRSLKAVFPNVFGTLTVPKAEELVATPYRHETTEAAEAFFLEGMTRALRQLSGNAHPGFPVTIFYAFKQSEAKAETGTARTGWETFLDATIRSGFAITGTLPMRTENMTRLTGMSTNALASSIVLVCRRRPANAPTGTRWEFLRAARSELPKALRRLQSGSIAPVDLAQAAIGPGMAVFTRYGRVLHASGERVTVGEALALINEVLDETLAEQEGDFDADTRWALTWFAQHGIGEGNFGEADTLSKAKNTSVAGLVEAGILRSGRGRVRLLRTEELPDDWDPRTDGRLSVWEVTHHLIRVLQSGGEVAAARLAARVGRELETARDLGYRLFALSEQKKHPTLALVYDGFVRSCPEIASLARSMPAESDPSSTLRPDHRATAERCRYPECVMGNFPCATFLSSASRAISGQEITRAL